MEKFKNLKLWEILVIGIGIIVLYNVFFAQKDEANEIVPQDYVIIPETQFKTMEQVKKEFSQSGLKVKFVKGNFDDEAEDEGINLKVGMTDEVDEQPNVKEFEVNDEDELYAKKGTVITVKYSDHDYTSHDIED